MESNGTTIAAKARARGNKMNGTQRKRLLKRGMAKISGKPRGFAAMSEETKLRIRSAGGCAVRKKYGRKHFQRLGSLGGKA
jgi:hypothetical protein